MANYETEFLFLPLDHNYKYKFVENRQNAVFVMQFIRIFSFPHQVLAMLMLDVMVDDVWTFPRAILVVNSWHLKFLENVSPCPSGFISSLWYRVALGVPDTSPPQEHTLVTLQS